MTKRQFIAMADAISYHNRHRLGSDRFSDDQIAVLADFCKSQNPNFDRERWLGYIEGTNGPNGGKRKS